MNTTDFINELSSFGTIEKSKHLSRFFKCREGEYGEGDIFLGVKVPETRSLVKKWWNSLSLDDIDTLIRSPYHEVRLSGLLSLKELYLHSKKSEEIKQEIITFYLNHTEWINNWDLVDLSCSDILGEWLWRRDKGILYELVKSQDMWERRISIVTTLFFVRKGDIEDALELSRILLSDSQDLIRKATGWVLREVGKKDKEALTSFIREHIRTISRTTLRYAIEKYPEEERKAFLKM